MTVSLKDVVIYSLAGVGGYIFGKKIFEAKIKPSSETKKTETSETVKTETVKKDTEKLGSDFDNWVINICKEKCVTEDELMAIYASRKPAFLNVEVEGDYQKSSEGKLAKGHYKSIVETLPLDMPEKDGKKYLRSIVYKANPEGLGPKVGEELIFAINQINSVIQINDKKDIDDVTKFIFAQMGNYDSSKEMTLDPSTIEEG